MNQLHTKTLSFSTSNELDAETFSSWLKLWTKAENAKFYNSPMWFKIYHKTMTPKQIVIIKCFLGDDLFAILPLVESRKFLIKIWSTPLSNSPVLVLDKKVFDFEPLKCFLKSMGTVAITEFAEETINQMNSMQRPDRFSYVYTSDRPFINLTEIKPKLYGKSFKRVRTKLRNIGAALDYELRKPELDDIKTISRIESVSFKALEAKDIFSNKTTQELYRNIINLARDNTLIGYMKHEEKEIISDFYVIGGKVAHSTHSSYDKNYSKYWPGNLLQYKILESMFNMDIEEIDLGRGINSLKLKFSTGIRKYYTFYISSSLIKRFWLFFATVLFMKIQRLKEQHESLSTITIHVRYLLRKLKFKI